MSLASLPAELFRQILHSLDPVSFYICLQTSKLFREHALASRALLLDQLGRVPGQPIHCSSSKKTQRLMRIFGTRAARHLVTGVPWMADQQIWRSPACADRKVSKILPWIILEDSASSSGDTRDSDDVREVLAFFEVLSERSIVNVYFLLEDGLDGYRPCLKHIISPHGLREHLPAYGDGGADQYSVSHVVSYRYGPYIHATWDQWRLAVLYRPKPPFSCDTAISKVLCFSLHPSFGPMVVDCFDVEPVTNATVVAMAIDNCDRPVLAFRLRRGYMKYKIFTYENTYDEVTMERRTLRKPEDDAVSPVYIPEQVADISVQGNAIHILPKGIPLPVWTLPEYESPLHEPQIMVRRDISLPDTVEVFQKQSLGRTIARLHHHMVCDDDLHDGEPTCVNTALELMISRDEPCGLSSRVGAFLLKAIHYPAGCYLFNMNADHPSLDHVYVAHLAGLPDLHNLSTQGLKLAVSPNAHRIAVASWKTVKVWSLDPGAFLDPAYSRAGSLGVPGDYAFIEGCGWQYYNCGRLEGDCVELEPVELPPAGVVFGLEFRDEDELWGWCEPGLVRWRFGVHARGRRATATLESMNISPP